MTLRDVAYSLETGEPLPPNSVAITVDDGYRNFVTDGYPVFRAFDIPVTVFLVSDFLDGKAWLWWDALNYAIQGTRLPSLTFCTADGRKHQFSLEPKQQRVSVCEGICELLKSVPNEERLRLLGAIVEHLEVEVPSQPPSKFAPLAWSEVRQLARQGVEFGGHTKTHPILSRVGGRDALEEEIAASKSRIEQEVGEPVIHFCYPNGRYEDFSTAAIEVIRSTGFRTAVTAERGMNFPGAPPFMLKRLGVEPDTATRYFSELLAGVRVQ
ncbi:MAG TPA: polysaccharide deacetylase family protein [Thermoanaerobaculia bacterium]